VFGNLKHLGQKVKKHAISQKHLSYSVEFRILGNTDLRNQLSGVYRLEIQKHNEKVKQNRYILRKLIDAIKFCGAFELALRGHDEGVESNNPGIFRGLINFIAEVIDILKLHIDQSKNTVFTGTDMDIDSNKNWDVAESKTRPSNLPDINLNRSELTRDTYLIFC
jgi:hypothetical protein